VRNEPHRSRNPYTNKNNMTEYRRAHVAGASWFFTVNLAQRKGNTLLVDRLDSLRAALETVRERHPFRIDAMVILPEHLHCIMTLPEGDEDFSTRWNLIKSSFSRAVEKGERITASREKRGERGIWQRRFWEHLIRDRRISIAMPITFTGIR
jgi:putative transposase